MTKLGVIDRSSLEFGMISLGRLLLLITMFASPLASSELSVTRHEIGPWPVISRLVGYGDRIWFANSVKGVNHNSADLYSFPITSGQPRYEGHLFSQDAGDPVLHRGLLYWPLEDARSNPGVGAFDVTDGERWEHGLVPTEQAFHNHVMVALGDALYAAPSAWKASIARSDDGGETWRTVYHHPTPDRRVSRITRLVVTDHGVYGALNAPEGQSVIRVDDGSGQPLAGWPSGHSHGLTVHRNGLFGIVGNPEAAGVWRSDGERSERVWTPNEGWTPRALISDGEQLWMAGEEAGRTSLLSSGDGRVWREVAVLERGSPRDLIAYRGVIAIGGRGTDDRGVLWVLPPSAVTEQKMETPDWPLLRGNARDGYDWALAARRLDQLLADPDTYLGYGGELRRAVAALPRNGVPPDFYPERLAVVMPSEPLAIFGDIVLEQMAIIGRWNLYWGIGLSRSGHVNPLDILRPWDYTPNRPFKFFSTPEIAIWAASRLGQDGLDGEVLEALVTRLEDEATPLWLKGDALGALFSITGERFGYDASAWRRWLDGRS